MLCAIWHHMYNLINVKNTHGGGLVLAKLLTLQFPKNYVMLYTILNHLYNLKNVKKHPWMSVTCSMQASANITLLHECFSSFSNGTIGTESRKGSHIMKVCPWSS